MTIVMQLAVNGMVAGAIYALVASGFSLIYSTNRFMHLAQGICVVGGAYILYVLFALLGIPSPVFWGIIMAGLSIIPLVGTNSIMVPAFLIHLLLGDYTTAFILLGAGTGVILINQNLIRPRLDADRSGMHTAIALIASLGGLLWLGVIGFLAGPLLTGLFIMIWDQYGKKYKENLEEMNKGSKENSITPS